MRTYYQHFIKLLFDNLFNTLNQKLAESLADKLEQIVASEDASQFPANVYYLQRGKSGNQHYVNLVRRRKKGVPWIVLCGNSGKKFVGAERGLNEAADEYFEDREWRNGDCGNGDQDSYYIA